MTTHYDLDSHPVKGILLCLVGYFFIALMGIFRKSLSSPMPLSEILFFQSLICLILILPEAIKKGIAPIERTNAMAYIIRVTSGLGCCLCLFKIICYMPISQAFLYQYSASLWIPFISLIWLGKKMPKNLWSGILVGFLGILFILKPGQAAINSIALMGILCGILQAVSVIAIRKLSKTQATETILFYYFLISTIATGVIATSSWFPLTLSSCLTLLAIGMTTFIAQKLVTASLQYASAGTLAPICYSSLLFSGLIGWIVWQELPDYFSLLGMALVITGCLLTLVASRSNYRAFGGLDVVEDLTK